MKNINFRKLLVGAALGLAVLGASAGAVPVQAATATIAADKTYQYANNVTEWTYKITVPENTTLYYNIYKTDPADTENGSWSTQTYSYSPYTSTYTSTYTDEWYTSVSNDSYKPEVVLSQKDYYTGPSFSYSKQEQELSIYADNYAPGTYNLVFYAYDDSAYQAAYDAAYAAGLVKAGEQYKADMKTYNELYDQYIAAGDTAAAKALAKPSDSGYVSFKYNEVTKEYDIAAYASGEYSVYKFWNPVYKADYYTQVAAYTLTVAVPEASVSSVVKSTSIQLNFAKTKRITGYEIYQKSGKKYTKIATTTSNTYTVKKLTKNTKYTFKIKPYYKDAETGKTTYGATSIYQATTIGSSLKLKTALSGSNVKLSWSKISGATEYNVYRLATSSSADTVSKDGSYNSYTAYEKIKTLKATKTSYTDKTPEAGESYYYRVEAVLSDADGTAVTVSDYESVTIDFGAFNEQSSVTNTDGSVKYTWLAMSGVSGYVVYQTRTVYTLTESSMDEDGWINYGYTSDTQTVEYKKLGKKTTSYTFPATAISAVQNDKEEPDYDDYDVVSETDKTTNVTTYYFTNKTDNTKTAYATYAEARNARNKAYYTARVDYLNSLQDNSSSFELYAYKGKNLSSSSISCTTTPVLGVSASVTAKATTAGIKVSWSPISGANYYKVYRVEAGGLVKDETTGTYTLNSYNTGKLVYEYTGYTTLEQTVDTDGTVRYYRNYSYSTCYITGTSVVDISGKISNGNLQYVEERNYTNNYTYNYTTSEGTDVYSRNNKGYYVDKGAKKSQLYDTGLEAGVEYQYYVVGYYDPNLTDENYRSINVSDLTSKPYLYDYDEAGNPIARSGYDAVAYAYTYDSANDRYVYTKDDATGTYSPTYYYGYYDTTEHTIKYSTSPLYLHNVNRSDVSSYTSGAKKIGSAVYTTVSAPSAPTIKSVKASGTTATITIKKKVKNATTYKIYRATKKNGTYTYIGSTTKLTYKDKGLTKGKTYYYKVTAAGSMESGAETEGKASKVKSVKIKKATTKKKTTKK